MRPEPRDEWERLWLVVALCAPSAMFVFWIALEGLFRGTNVHITSAIAG